MSPLDHGPSPRRVRALAMRSRALRTATGGLLGLAACTPVAAQNTDRPSVRAVRIETAIQLDGRLDDEAWSRADALTEFRQVFPVEGAEPSEGTEARLLFDADNLYIGVRCLDSSGRDGLSETQRRRDASLNADDHVSVVLDPFASNRDGYLFAVGVAGARRDALISQGSRQNLDWDGLWSARTSIDDDGWSLEIRIPAKTLAFDPATTTWGFNIQRFMPRLNETIRWSGVSTNIGFTSLGRSGSVEGLGGLRQGIGLTLNPSLSGTLDLDEGGGELRPAFDLFYNPTPSITIAGTLNTDFAEAEVDARRVNLTRFPLFFPEKRDFFLQDAGVFEFGGINQSPRPFFSRRIGIVDGEERDILGGIKVTGREGRVRFGLLDVQMRRTDGLGSKNLGIARATVDVLDESTAGFIVTNGDPAQRGNSTLVGADFNYRKTNAFGDNAIVGHAWAMATQTNTQGEDDQNGDPVAFGGRLTLPNEPWRASVFFAQIGEDFNPALGFVQRRARREIVGDVRYRYRPDQASNLPFRVLDIGSRFSLFTTFGNTIESARITVLDLELETDERDGIELNASVTRERLDEPFEISDGVIIPVARYDNAGVRATVRTSPSRPVRVRASAGYRGFFTGNRIDLTGAIELRPNPLFFGSLEYEQNEIDLPEGAFSVQVVRTRFDLLFTPDLSWTTVVQWDNQSDQIGLNSRVRWEFEPGNELFVVFNESLQNDDGSFTTTRRDVNVKLGMTLRF